MGAAEKVVPPDTFSQGDVLQGKYTVEQFLAWMRIRPERFELHGDRIVCMDLDLIITGSLDPLFDRPEPFVILQGANSVNPCPYNGSMWMVKAEYRPDVWSDFTLDAATAVPWYAFPDDQSWFAHKLPNAAGWRAGPQSGAYAFKKPGWPKGDGLPADARLVAFPGFRDPSQFTHLPWVRDHWGA